MQTARRVWAALLLAGVMAAGCDKSQELYEQGKAAEGAGNFDEAVRLYGDYLKAFPEGTAVDDVKVRMGASLAGQVEKAFKTGDFDAGYQKFMGISAGPLAEYAEVRFEAMKTSFPELKAVIDFQAAQSAADLEEQTLAYMRVVDGGTRLAEKATAWLMEHVDDAFMEQCVGPARDARKIQDPGALEYAQSACDNIITYAPGTENAKKAQEAKEGPLAARIKQIDDQYAKELEKEKARQARAAKGKK